MKLVRVAEENKRYYTKDFIHGFNTGAKTQLEADKREAERFGRWIMHINDLFPAESTMECNQCHEEQPLTCDNKYCPNCGAKMEAKENEND